MKIRSRLLLGFLTLVIVFITVVVINKRLSEQVVKNTNYLNNSETVIRNSNRLHKEIIEMQSAFRGFLLTNQESFLSSYFTGLKSVPLLLSEQRTLISSRIQGNRLDSIVFLHKEWLSYSDSLITAKRDTLKEANSRYSRLFNSKLKMEVGKKLNDKIRGVFQRFDNYEYELRLQRRSALYTSVHFTENVSLALTIFSILIALVTGFFVIRTITSRISKMVDLSHRISKGQFITLQDDNRDELSSLVNSLNSMSETLSANFRELSKKNNELDEFAYVVSHDLKAPLRGIINIISWIEEDNKDEVTPEIQERLNLIKGRADRLEKMINGLLEYARVGKTGKEIVELNLQKMIEELRELLGNKRSTWVIRGIPETIMTDKLHLEQVFSNLLSNALKHNNSAAPVITIHGTETESYYRFSISDNGPGIDRKYQDKIFIIFHTLQERDAFESTGVGLAIVKKIIEDQKGTITVKSEPGNGSTFIFTWPKFKAKMK
ncbi:MAG: CHASE3 domain-containing protein [Bacteroidia bacterium]|nr:CHASE3 domain-containing protein [Bacteroidia bacterium]